MQSSSVTSAITMSVQPNIVADGGGEKDQPSMVGQFCHEGQYAFCCVGNRVVFHFLRKNTHNTIVFHFWDPFCGGELGNWPNEDDGIISEH